MPETRSLRDYIRAPRVLRTLPSPPTPPTLPTRAVPRLRPVLLLLLLLIAPLLTPALAEARQMVSVDRPEINMRSGPGTRHVAL